MVNASGFSARSIGLNTFMFGGGPVRRYVGRADAPAGSSGVNVVPGGPSGIPGDPDYATQLAVWLTADYHQRAHARDRRRASCWFPAGAVAAPTQTGV